MPFLIEDVSQIFTNLREVFLILVINDAFIMLCQPFHFKEYLESKNMMKRYLAALGFWFLFHALEICAIASYLSYMLTQNFYMRAVIVIMFSNGWNYTEAVLVFEYDGLLLYVGIVRCWPMYAALREMDQNEFVQSQQFFLYVNCHFSSERYSQSYYQYIWSDYRDQSTYVSGFGQSIF